MSFYNLTYLFGFATMLLINLNIKKFFKFKTSETLIITFVTYICGVIGAMLMGRIYGWVMTLNGLPGETNVAISGAVIFTPIFMSIFALIARKDWKRVLDIITPGVYSILAWAKFGCFVEDCCPGREWEHGIYNEKLCTNVVPIQPIEAFFMTLFVIGCMLYILKSKNLVSGTVYPVTTMVYTTFRFFVEFFRYYELEAQRHVMFGLTLWQFCCVLAFTVSAIMLIVLKRNNSKSKEAALIEE